MGMDSLDISHIKRRECNANKEGVYLTSVHTTIQQEYTSHTLTNVLDK